MGTLHKTNWVSFEESLFSMFLFWGVVKIKLSFGKSYNISMSPPLLIKKSSYDI